eukprot:460488_1
MSRYNRKPNQSTKLSTKSEALLCAAFQDKILRDWKITKKKRNIHANPRKNLTFAQHIGVEDRPPSPLTNNEWQMVHRESIKRNDVSYGCCICCDDFKMRKQVLLSCSHSFHYQCLLSFERHAQVLCCPLCRSADYEKKIIDDGAKYWKDRCYLLIQNTWRAFICLKEYRKMQDTIEPKSPTKKERFYLRKFKKMNDNLISHIDERTDDIDAFLLSIDNSIAVSRAVFDAIEDGSQAMDDEKDNEKENKYTKSGRAWKDIKQLALTRNETDCSICMEVLKDKG